MMKRLFALKTKVGGSHPALYSLHNCIFVCPLSVLATCWLRIRRQNQRLDIQLRKRMIALPGGAQNAHIAIVGQQQQDREQVANMLLLEEATSFKNWQSRSQQRPSYLARLYPRAA